MPWFKVDDGLHSSRKVLSIPRSMRLQAVGLWTLAGSWCAKELTDGHFPDYMVEEWGGSPELVDALVNSGLWESQSQGFDFHNWGEYQPTKEEVEGARTAEAERKRKWRESRKSTRTDAPVPPDETDMSHGTRRDGPTGRDGRVRQASGHPDPTRPDPTRPSTSNEVEERPRKRGSRLSPDWLPTEASREKARTDAPDVDHRAEHAVFVDYWIAQPGQKGVKTDWEATWRNWMRRKQDDHTARRPKATPTERAMRTVQLATELDLLEVES